MYATLMCNCASCGTFMMCNPDLVPSIRINNIKEPICESCVSRWNLLHPDKYFNIPSGAYDSAAECFPEPDISDDPDYYHDFDDKSDDE